MSCETQKDCPAKALLGPVNSRNAEAKLESECAAGGGILSGGILNVSSVAKSGKQMLIFRLTNT